MNTVKINCDTPDFTDAKTVIVEIPETFQTLREFVERAKDIIIRKFNLNPETTTFTFPEVYTNQTIKIIRADDYE